MTKKRLKRLTKKERRAADPQRAAAAASAARHIHCVGCGRHIDPSEFSLSPPLSTYITCQHGSEFASCVSCMVRSQMLVDAHDRSGEPVKAAQAWH